MHVVVQVFLGQKPIVVGIDDDLADTEPFLGFLGRDFISFHHANDRLERDRCRGASVLDGILVCVDRACLYDLCNFADFVFNEFGHVHVAEVVALGAIDFADLRCRERVIALDEYRNGCRIATDDFLGQFEVRRVLVHRDDRRACHGDALFTRDAYPRVQVMGRDADKVECESAFGRRLDADGVAYDGDDIRDGLLRENELPAVCRCGGEVVRFLHEGRKRAAAVATVAEQVGVRVQSVQAFAKRERKHGLSVGGVGDFGGHDDGADGVTEEAVHGEVRNRKVFGVRVGVLGGNLSGVGLRCAAGRDRRAESIAVSDD